MVAGGRIGHEPVAHPAHRQKMPRVSRIGFEVLAQPGDEIVHRPCFHFGMVSPNLFQEFAAGEHSIGPRSQGLEQVGFEGGQMPLQRRLPKRGFISLTNARNVEVRLSEIQALPVDDIDLLTLKQAGVVPLHALSAKVILSGEISRKVSLKGVGATKGAKAAIEAAGGSIAE